MAIKEEDIENKRQLTNAQVIKYGAFLFLAGLGIARFEYKSNDISSKLTAAIEQMTIRNDYEKKIINIDIDNLRNQVSINTKAIKSIADFIKPDDEVYQSFKRKNR